MDSKLVYVFNTLLLKILNIMQTKHSDIFVKLQETSDPTYKIDATDLPINFILKVSLNNPMLQIVDKDDYSHKVDATIRAKFITFIQILDGQIDADEAFFSNKLTIQGATDATLALSNALDNSDINVIDDITLNITPIPFINKKINQISRSIVSNIYSVNNISERIKKNILQEHQFILDKHEESIQEIKDSIYNIQKNLIKKQRNERKISDYKVK